MILKKPIGIQDQYISALGGFQFIEFKPKNVVSNQNLLDKDQDILWKNFYLIYTDQSRNSGSVLLEQKTNIQKMKKNKPNC